MMKREKLPRGIRRRGNSLYVYLTFPDGNFELRSLGAVSLQTAKTQRAIWEREIAESRYVKPKERVPFEDICTRALEYFRNYTRGWDRAECHIARFKEWFADRTADSITTGEIDEHLLANLAPRGAKWSKTTANEYRVTLLRIFALAVDDGKLDLNPVVKAKRHRLENGRIRALSVEEEEKLRAAIRDNYPEKEPEFDLALHLGCRRSNLYGQHASKRAPMEPLQWSDVNLDFRVVSFSRSKAGAPYRVPINDAALAAFKKLRERCDGTGPVMRRPRPQKRNAGRAGREVFSCRKWFETCLEKSGIENFCYHDLRHTFATRLRAAGVSIEDIRYLLGHGAKSITERYAHPDLTTLRAAVAKLDRAKTETDTKTDTSAVLQFRTA